MCLKIDKLKKSILVFEVSSIVVGVEETWNAKFVDQKPSDIGRKEVCVTLLLLGRIVDRQLGHLEIRSPASQCEPDRHQGARSVPGPAQRVGPTVLVEAKCHRNHRITKLEGTVLEL